jgi:hypothetical protein
MQTESTSCTERNLALLLLLGAVALHGCAALSAGALWRDEANSIQQARLPSWSALGKSLEYDSFPALYPAILRIWSAWPRAASDGGLRLLGFLTGLALLASVVAVARMLGVRWPLATLVLLGTNSLWIAEGDSVRPYGVSLLLLLWTYGLMGRFAAVRSGRSLPAAALLSVLAVQASYTNAIFVGVICLCAAGVSLMRRDRVAAWLSMVPGVVSAITLLPYIGVLQRARGWGVIVGTGPDWPRLLRGLMFPRTPLILLAWLAFLIPALMRLPSLLRKGDDADPPRRPIVAYTGSVFVAGLTALLIFMEATSVPLFPRYFLPASMFGAFALQSLLKGCKPRVVATAAAAALLLSAWPEPATLLSRPWSPWGELTMRRSNVDQVAAALSLRASPRDLVIVSPWFLGASFQRYYRGDAAWISSPELEHTPMMRYDLVKRAMLNRYGESGTGPVITEVLQRGGRLWFVSQRRWSDFSRTQPPALPAPAPAPGGEDYVRFRSYWEREIEYRLNACCVGSEIALAGEGRARDEEDLILTTWWEKPR